MRETKTRTERWWQNNSDEVKREMGVGYPTVVNFQPIYMITLKLRDLTWTRTVTMMELQYTKFN